ncbi:MAG: Ger(x)C family spore germination C-terminal domain-containing protein [Bacillota bacterium]|nr:Ger(x)C family spore germination C-terminal domain-containing protein [Bacillota bacterium]
MSDQLNKDILCLLKYTQQVGSDPLGIGDKLRAKYGMDYNNEEWRELYKNAKINAQADVKIDMYGIIK